MNIQLILLHHSTYRIKLLATKSRYRIITCQMYNSNNTSRPYRGLGYGTTRLPMPSKSNNKNRKNTQRGSRGTLPLQSSLPPGSDPVKYYGFENANSNISKDKIRSIHIYDFDNTLFATPRANYELYTAQTLDMLQSPHVFLHGGWWQDTRFLRATGQGWEKEHALGWKGFWNEDIEALVKDSMQDSTALSILMTGRKEHFGDTIRTMCESQGLHFDAIILKPRSTASKTHEYKIEVMTDLLNWFRQANSIKVYEDRGWHLNSFVKFLREYQQAMRPSLKHRVLLVTTALRFLDPSDEIELLQSVVATHNMAYEKSLVSTRLELKDEHLFTGYILTTLSRHALLNSFAPQIPNIDDLKYQANAIVIRSPPSSSNPSSLSSQSSTPLQALDYSKEYEWRVTHFGWYERFLWAVKVAPVGFDCSSVISGDPIVILVQRKRANGSVLAAQISNWVEVDENSPIILKSRIGEWTVKKVRKC